MAKRPKSPQTGENPTPQVQATNESPGTVVSAAVDIGNLVVPTYREHPSATQRRIQVVEQCEDLLKQSQAEQLMFNVKEAQKNLTETLNQLSNYRKVVARILENKKRAAAALRKAAGQAPTGLQDIPAVDFPNEES